MGDTERISGGASSGTPACHTCPNLLKDKAHPGWGWCAAPQNRVAAEGWINGFTPSQSPSGTCNLHPKRRDAEATPQAAPAPDEPSHQHQQEKQG